MEPQKANNTFVLTTIKTSIIRNKTDHPDNTSISNTQMCNINYSNS